MDTNTIKEKINDLENKILTLPFGYITTKKINNKTYYYHRFTIDGKRKEKYINVSEAESLKEQILYKRELEKELTKLKNSLPKEISINQFHTNIRINEQLKEFVTSVKNYEKRRCYNQLYDYVYGKQIDKVFILYGLRRTGKTTLMKQLILNMNEFDRKCTVFIQIKKTDTLANVNNDLNKLEQLGYKYVFIDEVTLLEDFIEGAALFSDIFASSGMKIVLSGNDSLGFMFSKDDQLFDRCIMLHTTFITYSEFESVLKIKGIDKYIEYGGTMSLSEINYNKDSLFVNNNKTNEYIDSAIAKNIQHSLKYYQDGEHFRGLKALYETNELTSVINRIIENMNHRFTIETLTNMFKSSVLSLSARNLRKDKSNPNDILDHIDRISVTDCLKKKLEILNHYEQSVNITDLHVQEINKYLIILDLIIDIDIIHLPNLYTKDKLFVITQPGMRFSQANALIESLLQDNVFNNLNVIEKKQVIERIKSEIKGRMMEELVLLETKIAKQDKKVFKLQFAIGEFDMVVFDPITLTCEIYEIKYNKEINLNQYHHLIDPDKCEQTIHNYGNITNKYVIYRGTSTIVGDVKYVNVEEYLKGLYL